MDWKNNAGHNENMHKYRTWKLYFSEQKVLNCTQLHSITAELSCLKSGQVASHKLPSPRWVLCHSLPVKSSWNQSNTDLCRLQSTSLSTRGCDNLPRNALIHKHIREEVWSYKCRFVFFFLIDYSNDLMRKELHFTLLLDLKAIHRV